MNKSTFRDMLDTCVYIYQQLNIMGEPIVIHSENIRVFYKNKNQITKFAKVLNCSDSELCGRSHVDHNGHFWDNDAFDKDAATKVFTEHDVLRIETLQEHIKDFEEQYKYMCVAYPGRSSIWFSKATEQTEHIKFILPAEADLEMSDKINVMFCYKNVHFLIKIV